MLVQIALASSRSDKHPEIKGKHQSLKKRRGGKKATIAIARRLLVAIYHMLLKGEAYNPSLYIKEDTPLAGRSITAEEALKIVAKMGYIISDAPTPA